MTIMSMESITANSTYTDKAIEVISKESKAIDRNIEAVKPKISNELDTLTQNLKKAKEGAITNFDQLIEKYEPKISNKLGDLWEVLKGTTEYTYKAFIRYLVVKDGFPILIGLIIFILLSILLNKVTKYFKNHPELFIDQEVKETFTEYEAMIIKKSNNWNHFYYPIIKSIPGVLKYFIAFITLVYLLPNIYNIVLLIIAPEVRVLQELINLYKSI